MSGNVSLKKLHKKYCEAYPEIMAVSHELFALFFDSQEEQYVSFPVDPDIELRIMSYYDSEDTV